MKPIILTISLWFLLPAVFGQTTELSKQHSLLTTQCRSIRGHAGRILAEAAQPSLNRDVASAHLSEIAKFQGQMEQQLASSKKLLTATQSQSVSAEYKSLEKTCSTIGDLVEQLQKELDKKGPDQLAVRKLATTLRSEMTGGNEVHERMKKKLGI